MDFYTKKQSINKYIDKIYDQLNQDVLMISEYSTLMKKCGLETSKLSNYALAIKEEIKRELAVWPSFKNLTAEDREHLLSDVDRIHRELRIPPFTIGEDACMDTVMESSSVVQAVHGSTAGIRKEPFLNMGTAAGAIVGVGVGLLLTKSLPILVIGGIGGAVVGTFMGKKASRPSPSRAAASQVGTADQAVSKSKLNRSKAARHIQNRKTVIAPIFQLYITQVEDACRPIMK
ncbi:hypothetical protein [Paenibacillus sp. PL91]|uniref:hypothetical protein n=1 Tax=Paenibacillus sp. PL91 TaxID=2729538 RepID=UPI00145E253E|nr:hypothetical protein [Paenibacillus sp. PL91]MBC9203659.1 hypothetical protein [Paenibacillus sp. PL91]